MTLNDTGITFTGPEQQRQAYLEVAFARLTHAQAAFATNFNDHAQRQLAQAIQDLKILVR